MKPKTDIKEMAAELRERAKSRCVLAVFSDPPLRVEDTVEWRAADALDGVGWVSATDRLPEVDAGIYLVIFGPNVLSSYRVASYLSGVWQYSGVTHWMPLPPPPAIAGKEKS